MGKSKRCSLFVASVLMALTSCDRSTPVRQVATAASRDNLIAILNDPGGTKMKVSIGSKTFTATLEDNPSTASIKSMLPLNLNMSELNGNEKYFHLATRLPTDAANPGTIEAGDLMLWGDNSLVLFYKTFQTSYAYTRLGRIADPDGLADAVGAGTASVKFQAE